MERSFKPGESVIVVNSTDIFKGFVGKVTRTWQIDNEWRYKVKFDKYVNGRRTKETFYASYLLDDIIPNNEAAKLIFGD
jgi:hypothetical protein